jgi:hypothetical protein
MASKDTVGMAKRVLDHHALDYEVKLGKHVKIVVNYGDKTETFVTGSTVSDGRALQNFYHCLKRLLTQMGVPFKKDSKALLYN